MAKFWVGLLGTVVLLAACTTDNGEVAVSAERDVDTPRAHNAQGEDHIERRATTEPSVTDAAEPDVFLDVSNQSLFDPDVQVVIRGETETYVDASFPVEGQHHVVQYPLALGVGTHRLNLSSDSGAVEELTVDVTEDGPTYVFVNYWAEQGFAPYFHMDVFVGVDATGDACEGGHATFLSCRELGGTHRRTGRTGQ